ncbi:hypothetical protein [Arthrobacter sp. STN4]|nr:hypothetical protein [Arthrobacter sp. STN4]MCQ9164198.1 hypothetical protein [Arthrobacter sp. STN4]
MTNASQYKATLNNRLVTNMTDPVQGTATALMGLYHEQQGSRDDLP